MRRALLAALALGLGLAAAPATAAAAPKQAGAATVGAVIFSTDKGTIYEWDAATGDVKPVTQGNWPRLSPDGTKIAFHRVPSYKEITGTNIASFDDVLLRDLGSGAETRALASGDWLDAYNWVGNDHLVYDYACGIYENTLDGNSPVRIGGLRNSCYDDAPAYDPSNDALYFAESPGSPYLPPGIYEGTSSDVATQLFKLPSPLFPWPTLSPDGSRLLFACDVTSLCAGSAGSYGVIGTIGTGPETIQGSPSAIGASWTPDGAGVVGGGAANTLRYFPADGSNPDGTLLATIDPSAYGRIDWVGGVVAAAAPPPPSAGPCVLVSPATTIDFGTAGFSTPGAGNQVTKSGDGVRVTSCSDAQETVSAKVTDAKGGGASWAPEDAAANPCAVGTDVFGFHLDGLALSGSDATWTKLAAGASASATPSLTMPCTGSGGEGQTLGASVVFTATA